MFLLFSSKETDNQIFKNRKMIEQTQKEIAEIKQLLKRLKDEQR